MNETLKPPEDFDELAGLVKASFPNIRCLGCGHDELYLASDDFSALPGYISAKNPDNSVSSHKHPFLVLTCTRCGHVEHFLTGILERAPKPIERTSESE
jgi:predicted nucleic-acid-binding Zn-ribbon protein